MCDDMVVQLEPTRADLDNFTKALRTRESAAGGPRLV
jgi:hypothetical protein